MGDAPATEPGPTPDAASKTEENPFNEAFYQRIYRLLSSKSPDAAAELLKIHDQTLAYYNERGWTEYWGSDPLLEHTAAESSSVSRVKRIEKPLAPVKKEAQSLRASVITPTCSPRPSPNVSPKPAEVAKLNRSQSDEEPPKKKHKRLVVESSSEEDEKQSKEQTKKEKKFKEPTPAVDSVCSVCKELSVDVDNTIAQCHECSRLYHQRCHQPVVSSAELNDPRFIFVCMSCTQKRTKLAYSKTGTSSSQPTVSTTKPIAPERKDRDDINLFKRTTEKDKGLTPQMFPSKQITGGGLASAYQNFLQKHKPPVKKQSAPTVGGSPTASKNVTVPTSAGLAGLGKLAQQHQTTTSTTGLGKLALSSQPPTAPPSKPVTVPNPNLKMQDAQKRVDALRKKMKMKPK